MSTQQFFVDAASRHAVFVQRFAGGQVKGILPLIKRLQKKIIARLTEKELTEFSAKRLALLYDDLTNLTIEVYNKMGDKIQREMIPFAKYEAEFTASMVRKGTSITEFALPGTETIKAAIQTKIMEFSAGKETYTVGDALKKFGINKAKQIVQTIKDGMVLGDASGKIVQDIRSVVGNLQRHNAEALVRTITNHVSTVARMETFRANEDVLLGYIVVATLDIHTTLLCAGLDGKVFPLGSEEWPPYHWNCRTVLRPKVKPEFNLGANIEGERPSVGSNGIEQIGANTKFGTWLRAQHKDFKKEYFSQFKDGEEKYLLFEKGKLAIDKFTDEKGAELTLDELRKADKTAFAKSGVKIGKKNKL